MCVWQCLCCKSTLTGLWTRKEIFKHVVLLESHQCYLYLDARLIHIHLSSLRQIQPSSNMFFQSRNQSGIFGKMFKTWPQKCERVRCWNSKQVFWCRSEERVPDQRHGVRQRVVALDARSLCHGSSAGGEAASNRKGLPPTLFIDVFMRFDVKQIWVLTSHNQ